MKSIGLVAFYIDLPPQKEVKDIFIVFIDLLKIDYP